MLGGVPASSFQFAGPGPRVSAERGRWPMEIGKWNRHRAYILPTRRRPTRASPTTGPPQPQPAAHTARAIRFTARPPQRSSSATAARGIRMSEARARHALSLCRAPHSRTAHTARHVESRPEGSTQYATHASLRHLSLAALARGTRPRNPAAPRPRAALRGQGVAAQRRVERKSEPDSHPLNSHSAATSPS